MGSHLEENIFCELKEPHIEVCVSQCLYRIPKDMFLGMCLEVLTVQKFPLYFPKLLIDHVLYAVNHVKYWPCPQEEEENEHFLNYLCGLETVIHSFNTLTFQGRGQSSELSRQGPWFQRDYTLVEEADLNQGNKIISDNSKCYEENFKRVM